MNKIFLILHVLAAILAVGPVAVAASIFPRALRHARAHPGDAGALSALRTLHRICRVYAGVGISVPVLGLATALGLGVLGSAWLIASMILTVIAAAVLWVLVLPEQESALAAAETPGSGSESVPESGSGARAGARLAMLTGVFNLLWATVTILMIIRPGSTTSV
ncbi:DUF2269 family protein [Streptomyces sp. CAU 1734]|uniref:DUF2269 family protein n=1 Tax=Streptomyces sp. CAU 1734 TaxID=3140360 RepID=UPI0032601404